MKTEKRSINNDTQMIEAVKEACDHYYSKLSPYGSSVSVNDVKQSIVSYLIKHFELGEK